MNRLIFSIGTVVFIIVLSISSLFYLKSVTAEIETRLYTIEELAEKTDMSAVLEESEKLYDYFSHKADFLILFIRHDSIEELEETLARLSPLTENNDYGEFLAEVSKAIGLTEKLMDHELPLFKNIL